MIVFVLKRWWLSQNHKMSYLGRVFYGLVLLAALLTWPAGAGLAQDQQPEGAYYIVQEGDSLWDIALRFGVSMQDLQAANNLSDPSQLGLGSRLLIPGLEGIQGELVTRRVQYGESLESLARRYQVSIQVLAQLNHLTSPGELYAGYSLILPQGEDGPPAGTRSLVGEGESLLEVAVLNETNPWSYVSANDLPGSSRALPGEVLFLPEAQAAEVDTENVPGALPGAIYSIEVNPQPLVQGKAVVISMAGDGGLSLSGSIADRTFTFFPDQNGYVAIQGMHAMLAPGLYPLNLEGTLPDGETFSFSQPVFLTGGGYPFDPVLVVSPETIDPAVTRPEDAEWTALAQPVTPERYWQGAFGSPTPPEFKDCWPSTFGNRRSYNGSAYDYFHTGLDFCGGVGTEIFAPAAGRVVFAGPLTVRGNATMIDHGWGVYTGYMHQSEIMVKAGDMVEPGQMIGLVGGTGRVTGPHLHFEVWVGGVQVDPMDWLEQSFP